MGSCDEKPDYDYLEGTTLYLSHFEDGDSAETFIPDITGKKKVKVSAVRKGGEITVTVNGDIQVKCELLDPEQDVKVIMG